MPKAEQGHDALDELNRARSLLQKAERLRQAGQSDKALSICEQIVSQHPHYMGALHTAGVICTERNEYPRALGFLVRATMLNPKDWRTLAALGDTYMQLGAPEMATQVLETAQKANPKDVGVLSMLATAYYAEREYEQATGILRNALSFGNRIWEAEMLLGQCLVHLGQYNEAAAFMERANRHRPALITPLLWLSGLPVAHIKPGFLQRLAKTAPQYEESKLEFDSSVLFTRAALQDKLGQYDKAWENMVAANRKMAGTMVNKLAKTRVIYDELLENAQNRNWSVRGGVPGRGRKAISLFILGPSRSGKSTLETLVGTCNDVKLGFENPIVESAARHAFQSGGYLNNETYDYLSQECQKTCRKFYLDDLEGRAGEAKVFTNTHPGKIVDAAGIAAIIPNTRFVFVKRDPEDLALRIFMTLYAEENPFAYDLATVMEYITWYYQMIDLLAENLPEISRVVQYEEMVDNPGKILDEVLELCALHQNVSEFDIGDDRGCSAPYLDSMRKLLA